MLANKSKALHFASVGYVPHEGQIQIHNLIDSHKVISAVCGRQLGKSTALTYEIAYQAMRDGDKAGAPVIYIAAPSLAQARIVFDPVLDLFETGALSFFVKHVDRKNLVLTLKNRAKIYAKTGDNPSSLAGNSVSFCVIDEAGFFMDEAFRILQPSFAARDYKLALIGTPDRNDTFFKRYFDMGQDEDSKDYASISLPSILNPLITEEYLEEKRADPTLSEEDFRRFYLAEFSTSEANPFSVLLDKLKLDESSQKPVAGRKYVAGVDLADREDFSAVVILDVTEDTAKLVRVERWKGIGWEATSLKVAKLLKEYNNARGYVDRTGVGDGIFTMIAREYGNVEGVWFSIQEKQRMFDAIYAALEKTRLILYDDKVLISEMRNLQATQKQRGISYQAPKGLKDDCVMALFLAGKGLTKNLIIPSRFRLGGYRVSL